MRQDSQVHDQFENIGIGGIGSQGLLCDPERAPVTPFLVQDGGHHHRCR